MSSGYERSLDPTGTINMLVQFETKGPAVTDYVVILILDGDMEARTIRVYDGTHGINEMHRHTAGGGKQSGTIFHSGTLGEGMRAAIDEVKRGHRGMIEGWERQ